MTGEQAASIVDRSEGSPRLSATEQPEQLLPPAMYAEVSAVVNWLVHQWHGVLAGRRLCLLAEQLVNRLVRIVHDNYAGHYAGGGEVGTVHPLTCVWRVGAESDCAFNQSAAAVFISPAKLVLQPGVVIEMRPGEVTVSYSLLTDGGANTVGGGTIYSRYQHVETAVLNDGRRGKALRISIDKHSPHVWLEDCAPTEPLARFALAVEDDPRYTVQTFRITRFGSTKKKSDATKLMEIKAKMTMGQAQGHGASACASDLRSLAAAVASVAFGGGSSMGAGGGGGDGYDTLAGLVAEGNGVTSKSSSGVSSNGAIRPYEMAMGMSQLPHGEFKLFDD